MKNLEYLVALHSVNGLGPIRLKSILDYFGDPKTAWEASPEEFLKLGIFKNVVDFLVETRKKLDPEQYLEHIYQSGIKVLTIFDDAYPELLKQIYDPPLVLYYKGEILPIDARSVAIVGTRKVTGYGKMVTEKFSADLADFKVTVVSGLARGVDSCAHQTVVKKGGRTLAVLGGGLNNIFPPENNNLAKQISEGFGAVLSEFPPDHPSLPGNFPARNRIISGLSLGVLVTEAAEDSGSLITAKLALEQGRDVFAVPGPITSEYSKGPAALIKQGARLVSEAKEILEELGIDQGQGLRVKDEEKINLSETEQIIYDFLANEGKYVDEICQELRLAAAVVSANLIKLEIAGLVKNLGGGNYIKVW